MPAPYNCDLFEEAADAASSALLECYRPLLRSQPGVEAALTYSVTIAADGSARELVLLEESLSVPALQRCAESVLGTLRLRTASNAVYPCRVVFTAGTATR